MSFGEIFLSDGLMHFVLFWVYWALTDLVLLATITFYLKPRDYWMHGDSSLDGAQAKPGVDAEAHPDYTAMSLVESSVGDTVGVGFRSTVETESEDISIRE